MELTKTKKDERVQSAKESLRNVSRERSTFESRLDDLEDEIEQAEEAVRERKADVEVGDATAADVDAAASTLSDLKEERAHVTDRLATLERVVERLERNREEALEAAAADRQEALDKKVADAESALVSALEDVEAQIDRLNELKSYANHRPNQVDISGITNLGIRGVGVKVGTGWRSLSWIKQRTG